LAGLSPRKRRGTRGSRRPRGWLWVKSRHCRASASCPLYPRKRTSLSNDHNVRFVPIPDIRVDPKEKLPDLARGFVVGTLSRLPVELIVQPDAHDVSVK